PPPNGFPLTPGGEAAGIVEALGEGVSEFSVGDRVAYVSSLGAYATHRLMPADRIVPVPDAVSDETAAASVLAGLTVWYLLRRTFRVGKQHTALFHAAAGKVGTIA